MSSESVALDYDIPSWGELPTRSYHLEVIKNGIVVENIDLGRGKAFLLIGRLPTCDISLEHASISRNHSIIQFGRGAVFLYDLGSRHGTFLNKIRIEPRNFFPIPRDNIVRFGESTRSYVLSCTEDEGSPSAAESVPWRKNAVNFLKEWLEDRGLDMNIKIEAASGNSWKAQITVDAEDLDSVDGFSASVEGPTKKTASNAAAEAFCEQLLKNGLISLDGYSSKRKRETAELEIVDAEDSFFDRTGRKKVATGHVGEEVETFETLLIQRTELEQKIIDVTYIITDAGKKKEASTAAQVSEDDELEAYLANISGAQANKDIARYEKELQTIQQNLDRINLLINFVKPHDWVDDKAVNSKTQSQLAASRPTIIPKAEIGSESTKSSPAQSLVPKKESVLKEEETLGETSSLFERDEQVEEWLPPTENLASEDLKQKYGY